MLTSLAKRIINWLLMICGYQIVKKQSSTINYKTELYEKLFPKDSLIGKRFYNIGAGSFYHPFWTNIDFNNNWYKQNASNIGIHFDLMQCLPLPVETCSAEIVYTSHTIEHITDEAISNIFKESYRILKDGGCFRITAPDVNIWYRAFRQNDKDFFSESIAYYSLETVMQELDINSMHEASIGSIFQYYFSANTSPLTKGNIEKKFNDHELRKIFSERSYNDALTHICSFSHFDSEKTGYHINWVNADKTMNMLKQAGFSKIQVSAYGQSFNPVLRDVSFFDNTVPEWSFYVEAYK